MIAVIDYGASNLASVANAIRTLGYKPEVTAKAGDILSARAVVLPGVGAAGDAMKKLTELRLTDCVAKVISDSHPFFGICLGYQVLFESTEEGNIPCLGLLPGRVRLLPDTVKVPHMGWNQVKQRVKHPVFKGIPDDSDFYFVHSYYPAPADKAVIAGETKYGIEFASIVIKDNLIATQFHPEKSGDTGLRMLDNFFAFAGVTK
jgi:glutamine amidotransferase